MKMWDDTRIGSFGMRWDGGTKAQGQRGPSVQSQVPISGHPHPLPQLLSRCQNQERGSGWLFRRLALVPSNLFPTSSCVGGGSMSPASPHASQQPSTRPHSLPVCVVKSSQYSSPESVNSSVPCLLPLPKDVKCAGPSLHRASLITPHLSPGKWRYGTSPDEIRLEEPF